MKEKTKYNSIQNTLWILKKAWAYCRPIIFFFALITLMETARNLSLLWAGPLILGKIEEGASIASLVKVILFVSGSLFVIYGIWQYGYEAASMKFNMVGRKLDEELLVKQCATAFPNTLDAKAVRLRERAASVVGGPSESNPSVFLYTLIDFCWTLLSFGTIIALLSRVSIVLIFTSIASVLINYFAVHRADNWRYARREEEGRYKSHLSYIDRMAESVTLAKEIRIFGFAGWLSNVHASAMRVYEDFVSRAKGRQLAADIVTAVMSVGCNATAYVFLGVRALRGEMSAAEFLLCFTAVDRFGGWATQFMKALITIHRIGLDISALREYLDLEEPFLFEGGASVPNADRYELRLDNVSYRYPQAENDILSHVNLTIHAGEKLAVVGLNGAGKTTLVRVLAGLLDPTGGKVLLNGHDIREFNRREYYRLFSSVFQDFSVLEATVAENVAQCPQEEADREKVLRCIELAGLNEKLVSLRKGIDTPVGRHISEGGVLFSGGETQRLMMARALYKAGPILLLDEPTAALDPLAEDDIYRRYNEITKGKTALFISHRLASTRFCDRILYIADGGIAEEGTHEQLMKLDGRYKELFDIQSRYYREGVEF